ncbi:MAG: ABC transporter ATP-binding protein [Actinomycetota bacterium]
MVPAPRGPLRPAELAEAVVLADLAVLALFIGRLTPFSALSPAFAAVPIAVLAARRRNRAVAVAGWVTVVLAFLLASFGTAQSAIVAVLWGLVAGWGHRAGWGLVRTVAVTLVVGWTVVAAATLTVLGVFTEFRRLALEQVTVQWGGLSESLSAIGLDPVADVGDDVVSTAVRGWWWSVPIFQLGVSIVLALFLRRLARPVLRRVDRSLGEPPPAREPESDDGGPIAPVPLRLRNVSIEREGRPVLAGVDLVIEPGTLTVLVGHNGAGKSSLLALLAGTRSAEAGSVERPATAGLGRPGGVAVVAQRPETQVIGARVRDDLAWGLRRPPTELEIAEALAVVGLPEAADRPTAELSGGELQRVALAAALVRRPALLLSDESTAMIDPPGRDAIRSALRAAADAGVAVVHASHLIDDVAVADRVFRLQAGTLTELDPGGVV